MFGKFNKTIEIRGPVFRKGRLTEIMYLQQSEIYSTYFV